MLKRVNFILVKALGAEEGWRTENIMYLQIEREEIEAET
jgi:hypothetical protein